MQPLNNTSTNQDGPFVLTEFPAPTDNSETPESVENTEVPEGTVMFGGVPFEIDDFDAPSEAANQVVVAIHDRVVKMFADKGPVVAAAYATAMYGIISKLIIDNGKSAMASGISAIAMSRLEKRPESIIMLAGNDEKFIDECGEEFLKVVGEFTSAIAEFMDSDAIAIKVELNEQGQVTSEQVNLPQNNTENGSPTSE